MSDYSMRKIEELRELSVTCTKDIVKMNLEQVETASRRIGTSTAAAGYLFVLFLISCIGSSAWAAIACTALLTISLITRKMEKKELEKAKKTTVDSCADIVNRIMKAVEDGIGRQPGIHDGQVSQEPYPDGK